MSRKPSSGLQPYHKSLAGCLLAAREAVMVPIRPHLRAANVTEQQWRVLRVLADAVLLDAKTIAERALLYAPTVTRILKELLNRKLIERQIDSADGRRSVISITSEGRKLVVETAKHTILLLDGYTSAFGSERLEAFKAEAFALATILAQFRPND
ncbi:MAG: MarR family transcriptional regulator [Sphingobium sp.]